jgi:uncharacterized protein YecT (DUF1311 family)
VRGVLADLDLVSRGARETVPNCKAMRRYPGRQTQPPTRPIAVLVLIACTPLIAVAYAHGPSARPGALSAPVIHEHFTLLPCEGRPKERTTLQEEGCLEHHILATDTQIDAAARSIFALLATNAARRSFILAQHAWLTFRRADCVSVSDVFEGGTLASLVDAQCTAGRNVERLKEVRAFRSELRHNG